MIYDRNPIFPIIADKYKVRKYVRKVLGEKEAEKILIPLLHVTEKPKRIPFDELPEEYVVKANHGSGMNIIVTRDSKITREEIISRCNGWLNEHYGLLRHEWAYQKIKRKILVEKLIRDENGEIPKDFKFHVFHGRCEFVQADNDRFEDMSRSFFDRDWNYLDISLKYKPGPRLKRPSLFLKMRDISEKLGKDFDYIRVDLYQINKRIYFGELTIYSGAGHARFKPRKFDFEVGRYWKLPEQ